MRLRNIPEAPGIVADSPYVIHEKAPIEGGIASCFAKQAEIYAEIGTGKGKFLIESARLNPGINYVGIERYESVLFRACQALEEKTAEGEEDGSGEKTADGEEDGSGEKHADEGEDGTAEQHADKREAGSGTIETDGEQKNPGRLENLRFLCMDAREMPLYFAPGEISVLYLNFSDPWPKKKHAKRRLTSHHFLEMYEKVLKNGGRLEFKTDNRALFDFSVEELEAAPHWEITAKTYDLHRDPVLNEGNIMTEYERKFSALGNRICKLTAVYHAEN
jgi:tRNA (guanine-N7-)-methyltransferase